MMEEPSKRDEETAMYLFGQKNQFFLPINANYNLTVKLNALSYKSIVQSSLRSFVAANKYSHENKHIHFVN